MILKFLIPETKVPSRWNLIFDLHTFDDATFVCGKVEKSGIFKIKKNADSSHEEKKRKGYA